MTYEKLKTKITDIFTVWKNEMFEKINDVIDANVTKFEIKKTLNSDIIIKILKKDIKNVILEQLDIFNEHIENTLYEELHRIQTILNEMKNILKKSN